VRVLGAPLGPDEPALTKPVRPASTHVDLDELSLVGRLLSNVTTITPNAGVSFARRVDRDSARLGRARRDRTKSPWLIELDHALYFAEPGPPSARLHADRSSRVIRRAAIRQLGKARLIGEAKLRRAHRQQHRRAVRRSRRRKADACSRGASAEHELPITPLKLPV